MVFPHVSDDFMDYSDEWETNNCPRINVACYNQSGTQDNCIDTSKIMC